MIRDYSTGDITFRAETEIHQTKENEKGFERLEWLLKKPSLAAAETQEIVDFLHHEVDLMNDPTSTPDGKKRAKAIFSAAFGLLSSPPSPPHPGP